MRTAFYILTCLVMVGCNPEQAEELLASGN